MGDPDISGQEWDHATLMQQWGISKRTSVNYRKNGHEYFKRGGKIYLSPCILIRKRGRHAGKKWTHKENIYINECRKEEI